MTKKWILSLFFGILLGLSPASKPAMAFSPGDLLTIGSAFMTNLALHESAHYILANQVGAEGNRIEFFSGEGGSFFLGLSTVDTIDERYKLAYNMAGEFACDLVFESALDAYREKPTLYNKSLLFFSGTDFLWYTLYAFYLAPDKNPMYDPVGIQEDTGLSEGVILGIVLTEFTFNALRVVTGEDRVEPFYTLEPEKVGFGLKFHF